VSLPQSRYLVFNFARSALQRLTLFQGCCVHESYRLFRYGGDSVCSLQGSQFHETGILALGTVNFFPTFHYAFFCYPHLRDIYIALMTVSGSGASLSLPTVHWHCVIDSSRNIHGLLPDLCNSGVPEGTNIYLLCLRWCSYISLRSRDFQVRGLCPSIHPFFH
jgi:hypothetical protein